MNWCELLKHSNANPPPIIVEGETKKTVNTHELIMSLFNFKGPTHWPLNTYGKPGDAA